MWERPRTGHHCACAYGIFAEGVIVEGDKELLRPLPALETDRDDVHPTMSKEKAGC